jgi:hypothetical protein
VGKTKKGKGSKIMAVVERMVVRWPSTSIVLRPTKLRWWTKHWTLALSIRCHTA